MLELRAAGLSLAAIADKFEISKSCVNHIVRGDPRSMVVTGTQGLEPKRVCSDALPALPALVEGQAAGDRAMLLMTFVLSTAPPEGN